MSNMVWYMLHCRVANAPLRFVVWIWLVEVGEHEQRTKSPYNTPHISNLHRFIATSSIAQHFATSWVRYHYIIAFITKPNSRCLGLKILLASGVWIALPVSKVLSKGWPAFGPRVEWCPQQYQLESRLGEGGLSLLLASLLRRHSREGRTISVSCGERRRGSPQGLSISFST